MNNQALYRKLASYYDLIYSWKDYQKESTTILRLIQKNKKSKGKTLLEVGCGTGHHLQYFKKKFDCTGIDINDEIIQVAKKKVKGVQFKQGNMIQFDLNQQFDAITCLFSAIGYVKTYQNLEKTINTMSKHLVQGGVIIIEPWFSKKKFKTGKPILTTYQDKNIKIARMSISEVKGNISTLHMQYLIAQKNKPIQHVTDHHELGLFETQKTLQYLKKAGINATFQQDGLMKDRGLFVGIKQ